MQMQKRCSFPFTMREMQGFFNRGGAQMEKNKIDFVKEGEDKPIIKVFYVRTGREQEEDGVNLIDQQIYYSSKIYSKHQFKDSNIIYQNSLLRIKIKTLLPSYSICSYGLAQKCNALLLPN